MSVETLLSKLETEYGERLNSLDFPGGWTQRERDTYENETTTLKLRVASLRLAIDAFASASWTVDALSRKIKSLTDWRETFFDSDPREAVQPFVPTSAIWPDPSGNDSASSFGNEHR